MREQMRLEAGEAYTLRSGGGGGFGGGEPSDEEVPF
jgi:N-methylhydantoinase B/oxoprolinase/acetone carboxylase alpha subunit